jgi:membrane-associated protease RseP (regulator of RpoE activity)
MIQYKFIIIFYLVIIALVIANRKRVETQAKIIFLFRMKWGLAWMDKYSKKFREWVILLGYIGTGIGFIGMIFITFTLLKNLWDLVSNPAAQSGVSLVLPGINVPGLGVLPFWHWLIAIFIIAIVHEFAHGVVARAHNIKVKNTGIVLFGPIIGAFVEPDEIGLRKQPDIKQYSVLAAGAFANILLALIAVLLLTVAFNPLQQAMVEPTGFTFDAYVSDDLPFAKAEIAPGTLITGINNIKSEEFNSFAIELNRFKPGEEITVHLGEESKQIILETNPDNDQQPYLGIQSIHNEFELKPEYSQGLYSTAYYALDWVTGFLRWLFLLSLGIGLFNLLPLPIVDGGRMAQVFLHKLRGEKKGESSYRKISMFLLLVLLLNLFFPLISKLF